MRPTIVDRHDGERISHALPQLLEDAYDELARRPLDLASLKAALERLFVFLTSPSGRTPANCIEVDRYFFDREDWPLSLDELPESYSVVLGDIGGQLHDTFDAPAIAENFDSLPEQLLTRVRELPTDASTA